MKKTLYPIFLALVAFVAISCDNEPLEGEFADLDAAQNNSSNFTATINGETFVADAAAASITDDFISISGGKLDGEGISVIIQGNAEGDYVLTSEVGVGSYFAAGNSNGYVTNGEDESDNIAITTINSDLLTISGTFSYTALREVTAEDGSVEVLTVEITGGSFTNIPYTVL